MARGGLTSGIRQAAGRWWPWVVGSLLVVQLFYTDYIHSNGGSLDGGKAFWGRDFINVWGGGRFLREDGVLHMYELDQYRAFLFELFGPLRPHNYSYPPVTFPLATLFSLPPYWAALAAWLIGTGALFVWAVRHWWPREFGPPILAVLTPAATMNIWAGHYGFLIGALFLMGWKVLGERKHIQSGVWFGLMLIKPHLAVMVPVVLLIRRQWRVIAAGAATVTGLFLATLLVYGTEPWGDWFIQGGGKQMSMLDAGQSFYGYMSTSAATAVLRIVDDMTLALAAQAMFAVAAIVGVGVATGRRAPVPDLAMLAATATILVLPYAFNYDLTVVCVAALRLWADPDAAKWQRVAAVTGFLAPQLGMFVAPLGLPLTPLMLAFLFAGQLSLTLSRAGRAAPAGATAAHSI